MTVTQFQKLVDAGKPVGEVIGVEKFLVKVRGLQPINTHAIVLFEDGSKGFVHHVYEDFVMVLHLGQAVLPIGTIAVVQHNKLVTRVGKNYIGRVVNVLGEPMDGKGEIMADGTWPIFHTAPLLYERELLDTPLETGVTTLDILFSIVRGQRMAMLGDSKSGKSVLATQIAINQRDTDIITIYVLIGKRRNDLIELIDRLETNKAMHKTIVVVSTMFESLIMNYLAPYVGAAMGEYLWQQCNVDTLVIYDDLTSHAMAYREISLIAGVSPGRDSYPGDMFYTHSQLVERAGKLNRNHASQTIIPIIYAPGGDITAYLPTNVMSMTDGQWILDMAVFKEVMRPAISTGMSVTRVGGVGQNKRQKALAVATNKALAAYRQAEEYAHFGSELSAESEADLIRGKNLYHTFNQIVGETYNFMSQQFLLDIILNMEPGESLDIDELKRSVSEYAEQVQGDEDEKTSNFNALRDVLKAKCLVQAASTPAKSVTKPETAEPESEKEKKIDEKSEKTEEKAKEDEPHTPSPSEVIVPSEVKNEADTDEALNEAPVADTGSEEKAATETESGADEAPPKPVVGGEEHKGLFGRKKVKK
jgi:F-type H+/Na+-transporting ATPase subunit alpha